MTARSGPLAGIHVIELAGLGPVPYAGMLLAELGADVLRIDRPGGGPVFSSARDELLHRSRPCVAVDLKHVDGKQAVLRLTDQADVFVEGLRPGVAERLGIGPQVCLARNPRLVYGRMTGWGQDGPLARTVGHDINYVSITGALHAVGTPEQPVPPLNLVADWGGGTMFLLFGVLAALLERERSGQGQVVDAAMVDGVASMLTMVHGLMSAGLWLDQRMSNLLDGGAPFYSTYTCADGRHVAVGAIEPQFFAALVQGLGLSDLPGGQLDRVFWPAQRAALAAAFATRSRDEWVAHFAGTDACVTPVLSLTEARDHPHMKARETFAEIDGVAQPGVAPRFSRTHGSITSGPRHPGQDTRTGLLSWGFTDVEIDELEAAGAVTQTTPA